MDVPNSSYTLAQDIQAGVLSPRRGVTRAGQPITSASAGTSRVTTAPAAIIAFMPISMPGRITAPAPIDAPRLIVVVRNFGGGIRERGRLSFVNVTFGPT